MPISRITGDAIDSTTTITAKAVSNSMWSENFYQESFSSSAGVQTQTWAWTCPSYAHYEVIFAASQTNGGTYNNFYLRGIWSNNNVSHKWDVLESVGSLTGATFTFVVTDGLGVVNGPATSGQLKITMSYGGGFASNLPPKILIRQLYGAIPGYVFTTA